MRDGANEQLDYWQITGLVAGQNSQPIDVKVDVPVINGRLKASIDARAKVWVRRKSVGGAYTNVSQGSGFDLSNLAAGVETFEVYVEAVAPITGLERVPVEVTASTSSAAGWTD